MGLDWISRDGRIVLVEKTVRTVPYGFLAVLFPVYLSSQIGFDTVQIGIVLTLTVGTSAFYTFVVSLVADRFGRRRTLVFFALNDAVAGTLLYLSASWWAPVAAGIVGNMSVGAGETGPYLSLDQAMLPRTSDLKHQTLAFSVYNLVGYVSSSAGSLLSGLPNYLGPGVSGYRPLFLMYLLFGLLGMLLYSRLSKNVEEEPSISTRKVLTENSKPIVYRMAALFSVDAFAGGFVGQSILSYYFYQRYNLDLASLGLLFAGAQIVTAASFLLAAKIAKLIGLVKTMVFTHIPSNVLLTAIAFAPTATPAVVLLLCRQSLSQMDVPTRQSYLMSMVPESDRTPAAGLTNVSRTTAQTLSPSLAGYSIANLWIGSPFLLAGTLKILYDFSLYRSFHEAKPPQES